MTIKDPSTTQPALNQPRDLADLFWSFTALALQGFGGVLAVVQRELVERKRWMSREQFLEDWAVAQIMPGPNVVNLALMIGGRCFGWQGSLAALAGMLCLPAVVVLLLAALYGHWAASPAVQGALRGMGAVAAGLIVATGLKLVPALRSNPMGPLACGIAGIGTWVAVAWLRWPLAAVILGGGPLACAWAWHRLGPRP